MAIIQYLQITEHSLSGPEEIVRKLYIPKPVLPQRKSVLIPAGYKVKIYAKYRSKECGPPLTISLAIVL